VELVVVHLKSVALVVVVLELLAQELLVLMEHLGREIKVEILQRDLVAIMLPQVLEVEVRVRLALMVGVSMEMVVLEATD
jgi:hypothetical protein